MLELAQQLSYHLSVIDNGATAQLVSYGQQLSALSQIAGAARATLDSVLAPLMQVGNAWGQREQQINNIARTLRQYQYVGQSISDINRKITEGMPGIDAAARGMQFGKIYGEQFQQARGVTRDILHEMNRIAALLPGETSDYIQAFNQSLPFLSQARGMNLGRAVQMTSYLTAGGIAGGIDAGQTSRDLMQFLTMGPHMMDRSWTEVWSQYATLHGRRVTAEQARGMNLNNKVQVLSEIMDQLKPMMGAMGDSFEATVGTFNSLKHELYLTATEPIFESFKGIIAAVNAQLSRFAPYVGIVANYFAGKLATYMDAFAVHLKEAVQDLHAFGEGLAHYATIGYNLGSKAVSAGRSLLDNHPDLVGQFIGADLGYFILGGLLGGPLGLLLGAAGGRMVGAGMMGGTANAAVSGMDLLFPAVVQFATALYGLYDTLVSMTATILAIGLPTILTILASAISVTITAITPILELIGSVLLFFLIPIVTGLGGALGVIVLVLGALAAVINSVAGWFASLAGYSGTLAEAFQGMGLFMNEVFQDIGYLMHEMGIMSDSEYSAAVARATNPAAEPSFVQDIRNAFNRQTAGNNLDAMTGRAPPQQRPHTTQDFRYSRFDITQKFAEGFDPDRVASAMASDLSSMAEQQLESGFSPAFSTQGAT